MANTFEHLQRVDVESGGAATIELADISQDYTDLFLVVSARSTSADGASNYDQLIIKPNNSVADVARSMYLDTTSYGVSTSIYVGDASSNNTGASCFSNTEIYIYNYTTSENKNIIFESAIGEDGTAGMIRMGGVRWDDSNAITSIVLDINNGNFAEYSSVNLYGILHSSDGTTTLT